MKTFYILYEDENGQRYQTTIEHWTKDEALATFESEHPKFTVIEFDEEN